MTDSQLQTKLNHAFNEVLREWAEDDPDTPIPLQVALNALDDAKSDAPTILGRVKDEQAGWVFSLSLQGPDA